MIGTRGADVGIGTPVRGRESGSRAAKGRSCSEPGCSTILSTYNASPTCYLHTAPAYRHPLARD
jgi:hypothetical protein